MNELEQLMADEAVWGEVRAQEMTAQDHLHRYLGVRPAMLVTGVSVPQEQASEIIRRTDRFFRDLTSNDYPYLARISRKLRIPLWEDYERELRENPGYAAYEANLNALRGSDAYGAAVGGEHYDAYRAACSRYEEAHRRWLSSWGYIETEYVRSDWISAQYIYGPHGWCHPDGTIGHIDQVGKGQIGEEIHRDWWILARAFPFLDLGVTLVREGLYDGEVDTPQVGFLVRGGQVQVVDPVVVDVHAGHQFPTRGGAASRYSSSQGNQTVEDNLAALLTLSRIYGPAESQREIPWSWIEAWETHVPKENP